MPTVQGAASASCGACGRPVASDGSYCAGCGTRLEPAPPPAPPPAPLPPQVTQAVSVTPAPATPVTTMSATPSSTGRRASAAGWIGVLLVALSFTAAGAAIVVSGPLAGAPSNGAAATTGPPGVPAAVFDDRLFDGSSVVPGEPHTIRVSASNPAATATSPVWLVLEWQPADADPWQLADGTLLACTPADCTSRDDPDAHTTVVRWPGLAPGAETAFEISVQVTGIQPGETLRYHVTAGTGLRPDSIESGSAWTLELAVETPQ